MLQEFLVMEYELLNNQVYKSPVFSNKSSILARQIQ